MELTPNMIGHVRDLEISTRKLVDGMVSGAYESVFRGRGIEFDEIREYRYGDDVRAIDWNVTARLDRPYVKEYVEERDLQVYVVVDISGSGSFGSITPKRARINEVVASLLFAAQRSNDRAGMFLITDKIEEFVTARRGRRHVMRALLCLLACEPESRMTNLAASLDAIAAVIKRRSIIIIISDLIDDHDYARPLRHLARRHDVVAIRISDAHEREIPDVGLIQLEDSETGEQILVDTSNISFRSAYLESVAHAESGIVSLMGRCHIDSVEIDAHADYATLLLRFFRTRGGRDRTHGRI